MKILHVIDSGGLYGAEIMVLTLCDELKTLGHNPVIASIGSNDIEEKPLEIEARKRGIEVVPFRMRKGPNYLGAWKLLSFAKNNGFDIIHSHGYKGNILLGFIPRSIRRIPTLCTVHGWTSTKQLSLIKFYEWVDSLSHCYMDVVVLVHGAMQQHRQFSGRRLANMVIINNGIPLHESKSFNEPPVGTSLIHGEFIDFCSRKHTIGALGRLSPEKGFDHLIDAFRIIIDKGYDANLAIIGDGHEKNRLEKMIADYKINDRVMLAGYIPEASRYLKYFDIFVISSLTEGLPISLLEAMRARIPIVSTGVGGIVDVLGMGEGGVIVESNNIQSLADGIYRVLLDQGLKNQLVVNAEEILMNGFSSKVMTSKYSHIYSALIKSCK